MASRTNGAFVFVLAAASVGLGLAYFLRIHDWYWNHGAHLCTQDDILKNVEYCTRQGPAIDETYRGTRRWFGDDVIGNFLDGTFKVIGRWLAEIFDPLYRDFAPRWNTLVADDRWRKALGALAATLYLALAGATLKYGLDWANGRLAGKATDNS